MSNTIDFLVTEDRIKKLHEYLEMCRFFELDQNYFRYKVEEIHGDGYSFGYSLSYDIEDMHKISYTFSHPWEDKRSYGEVRANSKDVKIVYKMLYDKAFYKMKDNIINIMAERELDKIIEV